MLLKTGVSLKNLQPQIVVAILIAYDVYSAADYSLVITSASDSTHCNNSLHSHGLAIDLRIKNIPFATILAITKEIKQDLGNEFDVVLESDHIHIEYDPKIL